MEPEAREGFVAEVTRFCPRPVTTIHPITTLAELDGLLSTLTTENEWAATLVCDEGAAGAFFLFVSHGRALLHLTAGRCFTTKDFQNVDPPEARMVFRLDTGEVTHIHPRQTVGLHEGIGALRFWFVTEKQVPSLTWVSNH